MRVGNELVVTFLRAEMIDRTREFCGRLTSIQRHVHAAYRIFHAPGMVGMGGMLMICTIAVTMRVTMSWNDPTRLVL
jgi:hypothetical protein